MVPALSDAIATLRRRHGDGVILRGREGIEAAAWPTAMPAIDERLAPGGLPQGRLTVLAAGHRGMTGRLTLLQAMAAAASRSGDIAYADLVGTLDPGFLADLGAELGAFLVVRPPAPDRWGEGLVMARALVAAGVPWLGMALGERRPRGEAWDRALSALCESVWAARAVCVVSAPCPLPRPLAHASSLTLTCTMTGWQEAHGDVAGMRVSLTAVKRRRAEGGPEQASVLLRYPRPFAPGEVVSSPLVLPASPPSEPAGERHHTAA